MSSNRLLLSLTAGAALGLSACTDAGGVGGFGYYSMVRPNKVVRVGSGAMTVVTPRAWNETARNGFTDIRYVEGWTLNGPYLDGITFVSGLPDDKRIIRQEYKADRQVPKFRSNMTAPEVAALIETLYRVEGSAIDWRTLSLTPRTFMGYPGFQHDFEHLDGDELWRKGRAVGAVIDGRLYMILFDAARSHYYASALPDFEAIVASAQIRR